MDNLKAFLEADALRTQGEWEYENRIVYDKSMKIICSASCHYCGSDNSNYPFIAAASRIAPDLAKMVEDMKVAKEALQGLHDDNMDYLTANHLGGEDNHWMVGARAALARLKPYEKLFATEGER